MPRIYGKQIIIITSPSVSLNSLARLQDGVGVPQSLSTAESLYATAADKSLPSATLNLARLFVSQGRVAAAVPHLERVFLATGDPHAAFLLANCLEHLRFGTELDTDSVSARVAHRAFRGEEEMSMRVGLMPTPEVAVAGRGPVPPRLDDIGALYAFAADRGDAGALVKSAALAWDQGREMEAVVKYRAAAQKGHRGAFEALGVIVQNGGGNSNSTISPEEDLATDLFAIAAALIYI